MAISVTNLTTASNLTNNVNPYITASITLHANALGLAAFMCQHTGGPQSPSSLVGPGTTTWVLVTSVDFFTIAVPVRRLLLYRACNSSDQTGTLSFNLPANASNGFWTVSEATGTAATAANNGSDGIQQSATNRSDSQASPFVVTLAAFSGSSNGAFGVFGSAAQTQNYSPGTGFTSLGNALGSGTASDSGDIFSEWIASNDTTVDGTYTTSQSQGGIAIEIIAAAAANPNPAHLAEVLVAIKRGAYY